MIAFNIMKLVGICLLFLSIYEFGGSIQQIHIMQREWEGKEECFFHSL